MQARPWRGGGGVKPGGGVHTHKDSLADPGVQASAASAIHYGQDAHEVEANLLSRLGLTPPTTPNLTDGTATGRASAAPGTAVRPGGGLVIGRRPRTNSPKSDASSQEGTL